MAEHLGHVQVEGLHAVALTEREVGVAGGLAYHIHRGALALGYLLHVLYVLLVDEQPHALLALVGYDFLGRQRLVADGQLRHVYLAAAFFHQLRQTVQVACTAVVVDRHHRVLVFLAEGAHQVVCALLHLGVGALDGVQFDAVRITAGIYRRHAAATESDAVVVAAYHHHLVALLRLFL